MRASRLVYVPLCLKTMSPKPEAPPPAADCGAFLGAFAGSQQEAGGAWQVLG